MTAGCPGRDDIDWARLFEDVEWLLDGHVPADEAARRVGYENPDSLVRAYQKRRRPLPRQLVVEAAHSKRLREAAR